MALAQVSGVEDLRELSLEDLMNTEVISSTQQYVRLPEAPSSIYVVTGDQIRHWGIRRLSELVDRLIPGAVSAEDVDDMILAFRGITHDNNFKVLLLLNGHEYNTLWNNGPSSEVELGMMDDIKKVEVLVGPHSALYGSGALLGVINIITRSGRDFSGVRVSANYGSGDYKRGDLILGNQVSDDLNYFISAGGLTADGYENNNNGPLNISRFPPSGRFYGNVNYKNFEFMTRLTRSARDLYLMSASNTRPNVWTNYDTFFIDARRTFQPNDVSKSIVEVSYDTIETQRHDYTLGTKLRAVGENRYSAKLTSFYSGLDRHHFVFGAYYRRDQFGNDWEGDNFNFATTIVDGVVTGFPKDLFAARVLTPYGRNSYALYGQDSFTLSKRYSLLLGFRYERIEAPTITRPNLYSPRIALVITPNRKTVIKAMATSGVSRAFSASITSKDAVNLGFPTINHVFSPEKMNAFELSASYRLRPAVDVSANVFYNSFRDFFGVDPQSPAPPFIITNGGRIDYVGFEALASANLTDHALVRVAHQHVQFGAVVKDLFHFITTPDNQHLHNYPQDVTKLFSEVRLRKNISVNGNANLVWGDNSYFRSDPLATLDTGFYATINANLVWNMRPGIEMIFSGYNLLDERKQIPPFFLVSFLPERNYNVNLGLKF
jgi:iron complex outermembrane receptor protein